LDTLFFKNVIVVCFSILTCVCAATADQNETKIFMNKYGQVPVEKANPKDFIFQEQDELDRKLKSAEDFKIHENFIKKMNNKTVETREAEKLIQDLQSEKMQKEIVKAKKYILEDHAMEMREYNVVVDDARTFDVFKTDKRLFFCISSSMPKKLIQSYLQQIEDSDQDIEVVLNGFVGGMKKMKKTIKFINDILMKDRKNAYNVKIQINPKIFMSYQIKSVPALIYDPNYDNDILEEKPYRQNSGDDHIVIYGAASLNAMLKRIEN